MNTNSKTRALKRGLGGIEKNILEELSFGDLLIGYLASGGSAGRMFKIAHEQAKYRYRRKRAIQRLVEHDFIHKTGERLSITEAGSYVLGKTAENTRKLLGTKRWDRKWRIAIFDIPEVYAPLRRKVRQVLKRAGFIQLQQSVWIFPHECAELVHLIKEESKLSRYILYGLLDNIDNDDRLRKLFKLE